MKKYDNVTIFNHPLVNHKIAILRDEKTSMKEFRELIEEITTLMTFECLKEEIKKAYKKAIYEHNLIKNKNLEITKNKLKALKSLGFKRFCYSYLVPKMRSPASPRPGRM